MSIHARVPQFQITKLRVKNFRSIRDAEIELGPLTALVGPNASGKSNLLDALRFVGDALDTDLDTALMSRNGFESVIHRQDKAQFPKIEIGVEATSPWQHIAYGFVVGEQPGGGVAVRREWCDITPLDASEAPSAFVIEDGNIIAPKYLADPEDNGLGGASSSYPATLALVDIRRWIRRVVRLHEHDGELGDKLVSGLLDIDMILRMMYFYQILPDTVRAPQTLTNPYPLLSSGDNLASMLRSMLDNDESTASQLIEALNTLIPDVSDIRVESAGGFLVVQMKHSNARGSAEWFDLTQESDGTLRTLGILTALYQHRPAGFRLNYYRSLGLPGFGIYRFPTMIGIEEPELYLHPGAMESLAEIIEEVSERSQIILTTHSPDLIDRLPIDSLRVVMSEDGVTKVGPVSQAQMETVRQRLFSQGELHRMDGLRLDSNI